MLSVLNFDDGYNQIKGQLKIIFNIYDDQYFEHYDHKNPTIHPMINCENSSIQ